MEKTVRSKTYNYTNRDGTTQTAKVMRSQNTGIDERWIVADGPGSSIYLPEGDFSARANLLTDAGVMEAQATEKLNRARLIRAAVELFDDEAKEAEVKRERERNKALAVTLYNAFQGPSGEPREHFDYILYKTDWLNVAKAAREHIESEAADE
ncbi:hypothetical protein ACFYU5_18985 [Nocardia aobensis]|uniref:Uncharacterized protein n=1 Tax=Nocardia aobensis TaxID=257277 RepID=A0ABW6P5S3_9NOCA